MFWVASQILLGALSGSEGSEGAFLRHYAFFTADTVLGAVGDRPDRHVHFSSAAIGVVMASIGVAKIAGTSMFGLGATLLAGAVLSATAMMRRPVHVPVST